MTQNTLASLQDIDITKVLLVEDNDDDALLIREYLSDSDFTNYEIIRTKELDESYRCLVENSFDIILLDLFLPDSFGMDTYLKMNEKVCELPIILLTGLNDSELAMKAIQNGAQDYLVKDMIDPALLARSIRQAITGA